MSVSVGRVRGWHGQGGRFLRGFISFSFSSAGLVLHLLLPLGYLSCEFSPAHSPHEHGCMCAYVCARMCVNIRGRVYVYMCMNV